MQVLHVVGVMLPEVAFLEAILPESGLLVIVLLTTPLLEA